MRNKSEENWRVGAECFRTGSLNAAASRCYYAVYQAVLGFAVKKRGFAPMGRGAHGEMLKIVRNQGLGKGAFFGEVFEDLMEMRITADYEPETPNPNDMNAVLPNSNTIRKHFLSKMEG